MFWRTFLPLIWTYLIVLTILSCNKLPPEYDVRKSSDYPAYQKDSMEFEKRLIWAVDNGVPQKAIDTLKPTLSLLEALNKKYRDSAFWATYLYTLFDVGLENQFIGQWDSSYSYLQKAYDLSVKLWGPDVLIGTMCLNKLAFYNQFKGNYDKYHEYLFKSFDIRRRILNKNDLFLSFSLGNIADYYFDIGDKAKGKLYMDKALEIFKYHYTLWKEKENPKKRDSLLALYGYMPTLPKTVNGMLTNIPLRYGRFMISKLQEAIDHRDFKMADDYFLEFQSLVRENPEIKSRTEARLYQQKALYHMQKGDFATSYAYLDTLKEIQKNSQSGLPWVYDQIAFTLAKEGKRNEAKKLLNDKVFNKTKDDLLQYKYSRMADLYLEDSSFQQVIQICDSAYHVILKSNYAHLFTPRLFKFSEYDPAAIKQLLYFIHQDMQARYALLQTNADPAYKKGVVDLFDFFNSGLVYLQENNFSEEGKISQEFELYPAYEKAMSTAYSLYSQEADAKYSTMILRWSESHKAIALKNAIDLKSDLYNSESKPKTVQELIEKQILLQGINNKILALQRDTASHKDTVLIENLRRSVLKITGDIEVIKENNKNLIAAFLDPAARINYPEPEIKIYLQRHQAVLIDYFCGNDHIYATVVTPTDQFTYSIILNPGDLKKMKIYYASNSSATAWTDTSLASELYTLLLKPLEDKLILKKLIIIPDGILFRIPFESLIAPDGAYLVEKHAIQYEYSSKLLLRKSYTESKTNYAGFAPEYTGREEIIVSNDQSKILEKTYAESRAMLGSLKFNVPEVEQAAKIMGGKSFVGPIVDKSSFLENSKDARIVHLAMHAITDDDNADYSQLFFKSKQGTEPLFAYELNEYEMHTELAILSACNTGVGNYRRGDGVKSLARAFKVSGCKNILMSLWPANDASTKDIVLSFLIKLKQGIGKAEALREAKLDYLKGATAELKHPYYWAGLVLIGDNEPMFSPIPLWIWILMSIITLTLLSRYFIKIIKSF